MYASIENNYNKKIIDTKIYNVAIYLRLSREDENTGQSESIINQKEFLHSYVIAQGWNLVDIYIDDGYTGTNYNRPDFKRMIKDIELKKINLVITKDLSRLGRDYIDTGYYLERYFPEHDVRYIAINDGIDTFASNNSNNDMSPFKSVMNDMYAKDISKKVRTAMNTKRSKGDYIGGFTPYGYLKDPKNKNKLVIDEKTSDIVKRIFNMFVTGMGFAKIARTLNSEGIPSPGAYKMETSNYKRPKSMKLWADATVKDIIKNPTYTGNVTQNKVVKVNYKSKKLKRVPKEAWVTVNNTHEAIIDMDTFKIAEEIVTRKIGKDYSKGTPHLLAGLLFCGDCGERITFTHSSNTVYTLCSKYKRFRSCTRHSIKEKYLEDYVLSELKKISEYSVNQRNLLKSVEQKPKVSKLDKCNKEISIIENRISELKKITMGLYEDKIKGVLSQADFIEYSGVYNKEKEQFLIKLEKLQQEKVEEKDSDELLKLVQSILNFENVDKSVLARLIDKIIIFDKNRIEIHFRFKNPF
ncbi:MAG: recombinase family protein [Clostridia bacterium]|nr:recombinase family protein [Clostridia bacterium]